MQTDKIMQTDSKEWIKLPELLSGCRITECLQDCPEKKTYIIEQDGRQLILKYASEKYSVMLHREEKIAKSGCKFSFFPYVINCFDTPEGTYLTREYIEGETLQELVERKGPLDLGEALRLMLKVCDCLIILHSAKPPFIYRDLKASNILFTKYNDCYILDMGTIRNYQENVSMDTSFMGTSAVAAPEQYGARQTDKRTDVYGFGMLLYYLLTEEIPDLGDNGEKFISHPFIKNQKVLGIIRKCTAFDPEKRYPDMVSLKKDLEKTASYLRGFPEYGKIRRRKVITAAGLILSVAAAGLLLKRGIISDYREAIYSHRDTTSEYMEKKPETSDIQDSRDEDEDTGREENSDFSQKEEDNGTGIRLENPAIKENGDEEVVFTSKILEEAVRKELGKGKDESIRYYELSAVKCLYVYGNELPDEFDITAYRPQRCNLRGDIEDISLLSYMTNLKILVMEGQNIKDISPIKDLSILHLSFRDNPISDISALKGNKTLQILDLCATNIISLESLSECTELKTLTCESTDIESFSGLSGLTNLIDLYGEGVRATDYDNLPGNLKQIRLSNLSKEDIKNFPRFPNLEVLFFNDSEVESISDISMFSGISVLFINGNKLSSLEGIEKFKRLYHLSVCDSMFKDASPLKELKELKILDLTNNNLENYEFANELPKLEYITISASEAAKFFRSVDNPDLTLYIR